MKYFPDRCQSNWVLQLQLVGLLPGSMPLSASMPHMTLQKCNGRVFGSNRCTNTLGCFLFVCFVSSTVDAEASTAQCKQFLRPVNAFVYPTIDALVRHEFQMNASAVDCVCHYHVHHCPLIQLLCRAPQIRTSMAAVSIRFHQAPFSSYTVCSHQVMLFINIISVHVIIQTIHTGLDSSISAVLQCLDVTKVPSTVSLHIRPWFGLTVDCF